LAGPEAGKLEIMVVVAQRHVRPPDARPDPVEHLGQIAIAGLVGAALARQGRDHQIGRAQRGVIGEHLVQTAFQCLQADMRPGDLQVEFLERVGQLLRAHVVGAGQFHGLVADLADVPQGRVKVARRIVAHGVHLQCHRKNGAHGVPFWKKVVSEVQFIVARLTAAQTATHSGGAARAFSSARQRLFPSHRGPHEATGTIDAECRTRTNKRHKWPR
jgi:hypothetical protein